VSDISPAPRTTPRIEVLDPSAVRLEAPLAPLPLAPARQTGSLALTTIGLATLLAGFTTLAIANFVFDQFARGPALGWITLAVAATGLTFIGTAIVRELRALLRLATVDRLRARLANPESTRDAALEWLATLPDTEATIATMRSINDPDAMRALLRAGPARDLRVRAEALGQQAALATFALTAAMPSPALDAAVVAWRGLRLIRDVAALHNMRPGLLGTLALLRRTLNAASLTALANVAVDTAMRALVSNPTLARLAGDAAGATIAARRMIVLARAAASACSPVDE
jgi:putative membrane protein